MKHRFALIIAATALLAIFGNASAQILNAGFESWTVGNPDSWSANIVPGVTTVSPSATARGGSFAAKGEVVNSLAGVQSPLMQSGTDAQGFQFTQRPAAFTGYYQFSPAASSGDRFAVNVILFKSGGIETPVAAGAIALATTVSLYTQFSVPLTYSSGDAPDTCVIQFSILGPHVGSFFLLDDLAFSGTSGVASDPLQGPSAFALLPNYPNPFNPSTLISFTVQKSGPATLKVFNLIGQEVATLFDGVAAPGRIYRATFNASGLPSGIYLSRLESNNQRVMKRLVLAK